MLACMGSSCIIMIFIPLKFEIYKPTQMVSYCDYFMVKRTATNDASHKRLPPIPPPYAPAMPHPCAAHQISFYAFILTG